MTQDGATTDDSAWHIGPDRTDRLIRRILWAYAVATASLLLAMLAFMARTVPWQHPAALAAEARQSGLAGAVIGAALLAITGLLATAHMTGARRAATATRQAARGDSAASRVERLVGQIRHVRHARLGDAARRGQATIVPLLALLTGFVCWRLRPFAGAESVSEGDAMLLGGIAMALAFPALVAERFVANLPRRGLPEAPELARLLLIPVLALPLAGGLEIARGLQMPWVQWPQLALITAVVLLSAELGLRAAARWFVPPPAADEARAAIASLLAALASGAALGDGVTAPIRSHFGIDFSRSWALVFLRGAAVPALASTALLCWGLSGVAIIGLDQRGVYERLGAPVAVLGPGIHLLLPWPLGRLRPVEFGVVHQAAIGGTDDDRSGETTAGAEAPAPASADRLWDRAHPAEADYLIASESGDRQNFQTVSADIRVMWRVGLDDRSALQSVYGAALPGQLVREAAGRQVARFFADRTLAGVLGAAREAMAGQMRAALAADLAPSEAGIEIVAVVIEAIHPPIGAAAAYHAVQAAEITATTSISAEIGRARGTASLAQEEKRHLIDGAQAIAAETVQTARGEQRSFAADVGANRDAGQAFLLERYLASLSAALAHAPLTVIDHRLSAGQAPVIDLRPLAAAATRGTGVDYSD